MGVVSISIEHQGMIKLETLHEQCSRDDAVFDATSGVPSPVSDLPRRPGEGRVARGGMGPNGSSDLPPELPAIQVGSRDGLNHAHSFKDGKESWL